MMCAPTTMYGYPIVDGAHPWQLLQSYQGCVPSTISPILTFPRGKKHCNNLKNTARRSSRPLWRARGGASSELLPFVAFSGCAFNPLLCPLIYINRYRGKRNYFLISPRGSGIAQIFAKNYLL